MAKHIRNSNIYPQTVVVRAVPFLIGLLFLNPIIEGGMSFRSAIHCPSFEDAVDWFRAFSAATSRRGARYRQCHENQPSNSLKYCLLWNILVTLVSSVLELALLAF